MKKLVYDMAFSLFCKLAGISIDKGQDYSCLCHAALCEGEKMLKTSKLEDEAIQRFSFLVAVTALEKYTLLNLVSDSASSMKLMDASITTSPELSLKAVRELKLGAYSACSDLLKLSAVTVKMI